LLLSCPLYTVRRRCVWSLVLWRVTAVTQSKSTIRGRQSACRRWERMAGGRGRSRQRRRYLHLRCPAPWQWKRGVVTRLSLPGPGLCSLSGPEAETDGVGQPLCFNLGCTADRGAAHCAHSSFNSCQLGSLPHHLCLCPAPISFGEEAGVVFLYDAHVRLGSPAARPPCSLSALRLGDAQRGRQFQGRSVLAHRLCLWVAEHQVQTLSRAQGRAWFGHLPTRHLQGSCRHSSAVSLPSCVRHTQGT
jgi:hypothetical protein